MLSEITADSGCLAAWVRRVQSCGAIDSLLRLETWLKGLRAFFSLDHIPLSETEIEDLADHSFAAEIGIIRTGIQTCEALGSAVIEADTKSDVQWEAVIRTRLRRVRMPDFHVSRMARQLSPRDGVVELLEARTHIRKFAGFLEMLIQEISKRSVFQTQTRPAAQ